MRAKFNYVWPSLVAAFGLAGCGGGSSSADGETFEIAENATFAGFSQVTENDDIDLGILDKGVLQSSVSDATVGLVAYATGRDDDLVGQAVTLAGVRSGADVGDVQTEGAGSYNAQIGWVILPQARRDIDRPDNTDPDADTAVEGVPFIQEPFPITLNADFDAGTLTGSATAPLGAEADVNATIDGSSLGGTVTIFADNFAQDPRFNVPAGMSIDPTSVENEVRGQIGTTGVIGAFAGRNPREGEEVFRGENVSAGGFVGTRNP